MKNTFPLIGSTLATLGICLLAISCGDKNDNSTATSQEETAPPAKEETAAPPKAPAAVPESDEKPAEEKPVPTGNLESQVVGYWAPDVEAMMKELEEGLKDSPGELAATKAMMAPMLAAMAIEIPEKGKVVMHMMGQPQSMSYTVKSIDEATKTLAVEMTDPDGETESGSIIIGEDKLRLAGGDDGLSLVRIDEAAFKKRQEAKAPNILELPEGPGPDGSEDEPVVEELPAEDAAPEAPTEKAPPTEEVEKPEPAPEN